MTSRYKSCDVPDRVLLKHKSNEIKMNGDSRVSKFIQSSVGGLESICFIFRVKSPSLGVVWAGLDCKEDEA